MDSVLKAKGWHARVHAIAEFAGAFVPPETQQYVRRRNNLPSVVKECETTSTERTGADYLLPSPLVQPLLSRGPHHAVRIASVGASVKVGRNAEVAEPGPQSLQGEGDMPCQHSLC